MVLLRSLVRTGVVCVSLVPPQLLLWLLPSRLLFLSCVLRLQPSLRQVPVPLSERQPDCIRIRIRTCVFPGRGDSLQGNSPANGCRAHGASRSPHCRHSRHRPVVIGRPRRTPVGRERAAQGCTAGARRCGNTPVPKDGRVTLARDKGHIPPRPGAAQHSAGPTQGFRAADCPVAALSRTPRPGAARRSTGPAQGFRAANRPVAAFSRTPRPGAAQRSTRSAPPRRSAGPAQGPRRRLPGRGLLPHPASRRGPALHGSGPGLPRRQPPGRGLPRLHGQPCARRGPTGVPPASPRRTTRGHPQRE